MKKLLLVPFLCLATMVAQQVHAQIPAPTLPFVVLMTDELSSPLFISITNCDLIVNASQHVGASTYMWALDCGGGELDPPQYAYVYAPGYYWETPTSTFNSLILGINSSDNNYITVHNWGTSSTTLSAFVNFQVNGLQTTRIYGSNVSVGAGVTVNIPLPTASQTYDGVTAVLEPTGIYGNGNSSYPDPTPVMVGVATAP